METIYTQPKKVYKINLNSADTSSWTGAVYNQTYAIDMRSIVRDVEDYGKSFYMTFLFKSAEDLNIWDDSVFGLEINMNKPIPFTQATTGKPVYNMLFRKSYASRAVKFFETNPLDNDPILYSNIQDITQIRLTVWDFEYDRILIPSTSSTNPKTNFCVITFTEA